MTENAHINAAAEAEKITDIARLSAEVLEKGLVREARPVFVYDKALAATRSGTAARQAKHREKLKAQGLVNLQVPAEVADRLKAAGGDWSALTSLPPAAPVPAPTPAAAAPMPVPAPAQDGQEAHLIALGRKVAALTGWRARLVGLLLR
jgi:hypothetical protein